MADKEYRLGNNARELLKLVNRITKPISDEVSARDVKAILRKIAALDDIRDVRLVCEQMIGLIDRKTKEGFTKRAYNDYGKDMRATAKNIVRGIHAANGRIFATEHQERIDLISDVLDDCSLLLEYINACVEMKFISIGTSEIATKAVTDVKYPAASWKKKDGLRAEKLVAEQKAREDRRQVELVKEAIREAKAEGRTARN